MLWQLEWYCNDRIFEYCTIRFSTRWNVLSIRSRTLKKIFLAKISHYMVDNKLYRIFSNKRLGVYFFWGHGRLGVYSRWVFAVYFTCSIFPTGSSHTQYRNLQHVPSTQWIDTRKKVLLEGTTLIKVYGRLILEKNWQQRSMTITNVLRRVIHVVGVVTRAFIWDQAFISIPWTNSPRLLFETGVYSKEAFVWEYTVIWNLRLFWR